MSYSGRSDDYRSSTRGDDRYRCAPAPGQMDAPAKRVGAAVARSSCSRTRAHARTRARARETRSRVRARTAGPATTGAADPTAGTPRRAVIVRARLRTAHGRTTTEAGTGREIAAVSWRSGTWNVALATTATGTGTGACTRIHASTHACRRTHADIIYITHIHIAGTGTYIYLSIYLSIFLYVDVHIPICSDTDADMKIRPGRWRGYRSTTRCLPPCSA